MSVILTVKAADGATKTITLVEPIITIKTDWYDAGIFWQYTQIINNIIKYYYYLGI